MNSSNLKTLLTEYEFAKKYEPQIKNIKLGD